MPADLAEFDPAQDLGVAGVEHLRILDPDAGQVGNREEAAVVLFGIGPPVADQLVVLPIVHLGGAGWLAVPGSLIGACGDRESMFEITQFAIEEFELAGLEVVPEHR